MTFQLTVQDKTCEAIVAMLLADADLNAYTNGRIYHMEPTTPDQFLVVPTIFVWHVRESDNLRPKPGNNANPLFSYCISLNDPDELEPVPAGAVTSTSRAVHMEKVLEDGSEKDGTGSVVDPYSVAGDPPNVRFLNDKTPDFRSLPKYPVPTTSVSAWRTLATYSTRVTRVTRERI